MSSEDPVPPTHEERATCQKLLQALQARAAARGRTREIPERDAPAAALEAATRFERALRRRPDGPHSRLRLPAGILPPMV